MAIEPNPFDDELLVRARAEQEDPYVQYYIIRSDVGMSAGKMAAQVGHGAGMFFIGYNAAKNRVSKVMNPGGADVVKVSITEKWMARSFRKIALAGKTKDFKKIAEDPELSVFQVKDAGLTEVDPGTETVLVTWPMLKSEVPKFLKRLRVLQNEHLFAKVKDEEAT